MDSKDDNIDELDDGFGMESDEEDAKDFKIRDSLEPPVLLSFTTKILHTLIHQGAIDLNPSYQRDVVWPTSKQVHLIDSIFRNFYIPPVVFAVQKDEEGEETRVCVDGKQRLTSIQKFIDGQIPHRDLKTKRNYWFTIPETQKHSRLVVPARWREQFSEKVISCVEYSNLPPGSEREIFQRVQLGMTLTVAEKLQAIASPWAEWISDLETRHVRAERGLATVLQWDTKRGRDFQCIAQFIYCCDGLPDHLFPTAPKMEKWLCRADSPTASFKALITSVLNEFWVIATDEELKYGFTDVGKRLAPIEFVFVGVLLFVLRNNQREERAWAIFEMRKDIRDKFIDIRANTQVTKALWTFIKSLGSGANLAQRSNQLAKSKKKKRVRERDDEESDDEYRPEPILSLGRAPKTRSKYQ